MHDVIVWSVVLSLWGGFIIVALELQEEASMTQSDLEKQRHSVLLEMGSITRMRRGTVNVQTLTSRRRDGSMVTHGPYYLYSRTEKGRSYSQRLPEEAVKQYQEETESCRRFKELAQRYILICEQLADREVEGKKNSKPRSPRRSSPKSRRS